MNTTAAMPKGTRAQAGKLLSPKSDTARHSPKATRAEQSTSSVLQTGLRAVRWGGRTLLRYGLRPLAYALLSLFQRKPLVKFLPSYLVLAAALVFGLPAALNAGKQVVARVNAGETFFEIITPHGAPSYRAGQLAPFFTVEIKHWGDDIVRWAAIYGVDPNLLATVMQIESCGHADISSSAGAQGLFQVMPFHFASDEVQTDPETNARRGASFLAECMRWGDGNPARALACYNGGPGVLNRDFSRWPAETQRYYVWGGGIYLDAINGREMSATLNSWLEAGGRRLCQMASDNIAAKMVAVG